jgi:hypothetical protein
MNWLPRFRIVEVSTGSPFGGRPVDELDFDGRALIIQWGRWQLSIELARAFD